MNSRGMAGPVHGGSCLGGPREKRRSGDMEVQAGTLRAQTLSSNTFQTHRQWCALQDWRTHNPRVAEGGGQFPTVPPTPIPHPLTPPADYSLILKASFLGNPDFFTGLSLELPVPGAHPHIPRGQNVCPFLPCTFQLVSSGWLLNSWYLGGSPVPEDLNHPATQGYANAALPMPAAAVSEESCSLSLS